MEFSQEVPTRRRWRRRLSWRSVGKGKKVTVEQVSCDFTKENFAAKPDLSAPGADDVPEKEFCDNCGKEMVLKNGPWGPFMSCPDYSADPPCKTIRKLTQKVQQKPPVVLEEMCPKCGKPLLQRDGQYGEFIACSGLSEVQVCEAGAAGGAVPEGRRRHCGAQDAARRCFLWVRELSEVRLCQQPEAGEPDLPEVRQRVSAGVANAKGTLPGVPEQPRGAAEAEARRARRRRAPTTPECSYKKKIGPPKEPECRC
jgi:DNA topoisomerase-1